MQRILELPTRQSTVLSYHHPDTIRSAEMFERSLLQGLQYIRNYLNFVFSINGAHSPQFEIVCQLPEDILKQHQNILEKPSSILPARRDRAREVASDDDYSIWQPPQKLITVDGMSDAYFELNEFKENYFKPDPICLPRLHILTIENDDFYRVNALVYPLAHELDAYVCKVGERPTDSPQALIRDVIRDSKLWLEENQSNCKRMILHIRQFDRIGDSVEISIAKQKPVAAITYQQLFELFETENAWDNFVVVLSGPDISSFDNGLIGNSVQLRTHSSEIDIRDALITAANRLQGDSNGIVNFDKVSFHEAADELIKSHCRTHIDAIMALRQAVQHKRPALEASKGNTMIIEKHDILAAWQEINSQR